MPTHWDDIDIFTPRQEVIQYTALRPVGCADDWPEDSKRKLVWMDSWEQFARHLGLPYIDQLWSSLSRNGPPQVPAPDDALIVANDLLALETHKMKPTFVKPGVFPSTDSNKIEDMERTIQDLSRQVSELNEVVYQESASSSMLPW